MRIGILGAGAALAAATATTYTITDSDVKSDDSLPIPKYALKGSIPGATGGTLHDQAKNRAAKYARRINRLTRNGQHL